MVPDKFNMVNMGGVDILLEGGTEVPGLYQRLVESIAQCRYQCLYDWLFDGIQIPPTYVQLEVDDETGYVYINDGIWVTDEDILKTIGSVYPELETLSVTENGTYIPDEGIYGFSSVDVNVPDIPPVLIEITATDNGTYTPGGNVDGFSKVVVNVSAPQPVLEALTATVNGTYNPGTGVDGFSSVTVNVPTPPASVLTWEASVY